MNSERSDADSAGARDVASHDSQALAASAGKPDTRDAALHKSQALAASAGQSDAAHDATAAGARLPAPTGGEGRSAALRGRGATRAPTFYVAGFWRRLLGAAVDLAVIIPVSLILSWLAGAMTGVSLPESRHRGLDFWLDLLLASDPALIGILGLMLAIATIYVLVFQITLARTLGMRVMRVRIIDQYGEPLSVGRAAARTAGYLMSIATLGLGFLWMGFDSEKRGLHDWLSGTYVVKA